MGEFDPPFSLTIGGEATSQYYIGCSIGLEIVIAWTADFGCDTASFEILPGPPDAIIFVDIPDTLLLVADGVDNAWICVEVFDSCGNLVGDEHLIHFDTEPPLAFPEPYEAYTDSGRACTTLRADTVTGIGYMVAIYGDTFSTTTVHPIKLGATAIHENNYGLPVGFTIDAHPNPFNSAVSIALDYHSRERGNPERVTVEIIDVAGRKVAQLPVGEGLVPSRTSGDHKGLPYEYIWQPGVSITSGVYLVRAKIGDESITKRIVYVK